MANPIFKLDGLEVLDSSFLFEQAEENGWETSHWAGKANSFKLSKGRMPGHGYVLMQQSLADSLQVEQGGHTLTIQEVVGPADVGFSPRSLSLSNLYILSVKALYTESTNIDPGAACLVELVDRRHFFLMSTVTKTYNTICPAPADTSGANLYDSESLNSGSLWTWATMFSDLWSMLPNGGSAPSLPFSPDGSPQDFQFFGVSAWDAILVLLNKLSCGITYSPYADTFSVYEEGVSQPGLTTILAQANPSNNRRALADYNATTSQVTRIPKTVRVFFRCVYQHYGTEKATGRTGNFRQNCFHFEDIPTSNSNAVSGTYITIRDDLVGLLDFSGSLTNTAALNTRATEVATKLVNRLSNASWVRSAYDGLVTAVLPGSDVESVLWGDLGEGGGLFTEIQRTPEYTWGTAPADTDNYASTTPTGPYTFSSRENLGLLAAIPEGNPREENRTTYPHVVHMVRVDGSGGSLATPTGSGLFSGKVVRDDPTQDFSTSAPYVDMEACWIAVANPLVGSATAYVKLSAGDRFFGRLYGSATVSGSTRPLYVIVRSENLVWAITAASTVAPGAGLSVTLPDGRSVTAVNQTATTINSGDRATVYEDLTNASFFLTGGGSGSNPDNMAIVTAYGPTASGTGLWNGKLCTPSGGSDYTTNQFPNAGTNVLLTVLNTETGSIATTKANLVVGDPYIGRFVGTISGTSVYAIQISDRVFHVTIPSPGCGPGATIAGVVLPNGVTVTATNWSQVALDTDDKAYAAKDLTDGNWYLWVSAGGLKAYAATVPAASPGIGFGAAGTITLFTGDDVSATNLTSLVDVSANENVFAFIDVVSGSWGFIKGGEKSVEIWKATLGSNVAAGATVSVTLPDTTVITATNWSGSSLNSGDKILVIQDYGVSVAARDWYIIKPDGVNTKNVWTATLTTALLSTDTNAFFTGGLIGDDAPAGITQATNIHQLQGLVSNKVTIGRQIAGAAVSYWVIQATPPHTTRRYKALLNAALHKADANATIDTVTALDGGTAPSPTSAANFLRWAGNDDDPVLIIEDWSSGSVAYILEAVAWDIVSPVTNSQVDSGGTPTELQQVKTDTIGKTNAAPATTNVVPITTC